MFLVLADPGDPLAGRVHDALCARHGAGGVRLLRSEDLALGVSWGLRQDGPRVRTGLRFADGEALGSDETGGVFNRLRSVSVPQFEGSSPVDREYAALEMHAFLLSWLASLDCPLVNPAGPRSLGGDGTGAAEWLLLAGRAGLPVRGMRFATNARRFPRPASEPFVLIEGSLRPVSRAILGSSPAHFLEPVEAERRRIVVVGGRAHGGRDLPAALEESCVRLARDSGCPLLELTFARSSADGEWKLCAASPFPRELDEEELESLLHLLETGS